MNGYSIFADTLADMAWPAVEAAGKRNLPLLMPVAVIEQHSLHLPLATDTYGAVLLCRLIKARLAELGHDSVVAPPYYWGINASTCMFPGSFTVRPETMTAALVDILAGCASWGFTRQFVINHHGDTDHNRALAEAVGELRDRHIETTYVLGGLIAGFVPSTSGALFGERRPLSGDELLRVADSETTKAARGRLTRSPGLDVHAGERETSLIMRFFPETMAGDVDHRALQPAPETLRQFVKAERSGGWRELSPDGHIGDPARATVDNGELYEYEATDMAAAIAGFLEARVPKS